MVKVAVRGGRRHRDGAAERPNQVARDAQAGPVRPAGWSLPRARRCARMSAEMPDPVSTSILTRRPPFALPVQRAAFRHASSALVTRFNKASSSWASSAAAGHWERASARVDAAARGRASHRRCGL